MRQENSLRAFVVVTDSGSLDFAWPSFGRSCCARDDRIFVQASLLKNEAIADCQYALRNA